MFYIIRCYTPPSINTSIEESDINTFKLSHNKESIKHVQNFFEMIEQGQSKKNIKILAENIVENMTKCTTSKDIDSLLNVYDQYFKSFQGRKSNALKFCLLKSKDNIVIDILNVWHTYTQ
jgi:hypothetical protein